MATTVRSTGAASGHGRARIAWVMACVLAIGAWAPAASADRQSGWVGRIAGILSGQPGVGPLTQREADQGIREALAVAASNAGERLARPDAFLASPKIHIPLPGALSRAQTRLRTFGMSGPLDEMEVGLNHAAEAAMPEAKRLALDAVRSLTLGDALAILRGGDEAATTFLRQRTQAGIAAALRPHVVAALDRTGAFRALDQARQNPLVQSVAGDARKDITDFAVQKSVDGFFQILAEEERGIRSDPARRTSAILKRVFGTGTS